MKPLLTCFWRRLDAPGTDACRLYRRGEGWLLQGTAVFNDQGLACALRYEAEAGDDWRSRRARVDGHCGGREIEIELRRSASGFWQVNGANARLATPCDDIDLGFTPATNLLALRRLALPIGGSGESHAAWLDFPEFTCRHLPQTYHRRDLEDYDYTSPTAGYQGRLRVLTNGIVAAYPGLFELVGTASG